MALAGYRELSSLVTLISQRMSDYYRGRPLETLSKKLGGTWRKKGRRKRSSLCGDGGGEDGTDIGGMNRGDRSLRLSWVGSSEAVLIWPRQSPNEITYHSFHLYPS